MTRICIVQEYKGFSINSDCPTNWWAYQKKDEVYYHLNKKGEIKRISAQTNTGPFYFTSLDQVKSTINKVVKASDKEVQLMEFVELRFGQVIEQLRSSISPSDMLVVADYIKEKLLK